VAQCAIRLEGELNVRALLEALQLVVERCEILRTVFRSLPTLGMPLQIVTDGFAPSWRTLDLRQQSGSDVNAVIEGFLQQEARQRFEHDHEPALRTLLVTLPEREHLLIVTAPALCADSGTLGNLFAEISHCYAAILEGGRPEQEAIPYVQICEWQNELLEEEEAGEGKDFWRRWNAVAQATDTLPCSADLVSVEADFARLAVQLPPEVNAQLEFLAERHKSTTASWLLACWQTLLWRLMPEPVIVVGESYDGREFEMLSGVLGPLEKFLPVRVQFSETARFSDVVAGTVESSRTVREWQEYFVWRSDFGVGEDADDNRVASYLPFGFEFAQWPAPRQLGGINFSIYQLHSETERFDVKLSCARSENALTLTFHYDTSRFHLQDIVRLSDQFHCLLASTLRCPEATLKELNVLGEAARHQLLIEWNDTETSFASHLCVHELFAAQAARTPERVAVVCGDEQLTYAEVNTRSNKVAHHLRSLGVGPEAVVGLCMERSVEMIVGLFGILKAGGAYLPLDSSYPSERLRFMLDDAGASILLTERRVSGGLPEMDIRVLYIDSDWSQIATSPGDDPPNVATPENLAYVIYTSGSTGSPKGVMIQHRSVVNLEAALRAAVYGQAETPLRVGLNAPFVFDGSVKQIIQLLRGHTLHVLAEELRLDPVRLQAYVDAHRLDVLDLTPSQLKLMLSAGIWDGKRGAPSTMLIGGEAIDNSLWTALSEQTTTRFFNVYGPTECTVDATVCDVRGSAAQPSIGRPLANVQVYVLDENMQPLPVGVAGELYVSGSGLARGYLRSPVLTAQRFVPHPFSSEPGARVYRTGDRARFLPGGQLEFLGRLDDQVKLRGFRVELGEIESALLAQEGVREAAVVLAEDRRGDRRLVAYFVTHGEPAPTAHELRNKLRQRLPDYMMPSTFVALDALPLTRQGKVNKNALPEPAAGDREAAFVAPRNEIEQTIAGIWQELLQIDKVGVHDNFFDLGGHSLLMVQAHNKLSRAFERDISVLELFKNPTVSALTSFFASAPRPVASLREVSSRAERRRQAAGRHRELVREKSSNGV